MVASAEPSQLWKEKVSEGSRDKQFLDMLKIILILPVKNNAFVVGIPVWYTWVIWEKLDWNTGADTEIPNTQH